MNLLSPDPGNPVRRDQLHRTSRTKGTGQT